MDFRKIRLYKAFAKGRAKECVAYKSNVIMGVIGQIIMVLVTYFLWKAIYTSSTESVIKGFTLNEMLVYVMITFLIGYVTSSDVSYMISDEVKSGAIAMNLIKPINYRRRMVAASIGQFSFLIVLLFLPGAIGITAYGIINGVDINFASIIIFVISVFLGFLINTYYSYLFGLLAFKFYNLWGIGQIANAIIMLISGSLIPLTFFPELVQKAFNFLPFSSMIYTPAMIYLNKLSTFEIAKALILQVVWIIILIGLSKIMWNKVIDKLTIQGG
ncbi:ABC transporter permease [Clostridium sp.]|uniref:ABC transporter permease n=1 Tax=Clostridium sp. TaxID=1506 RepID=UPI002FCA8F6B